LFSFRQIKGKKKVYQNKKEEDIAEGNIDPNITHQEELSQTKKVLV
jgi:hypothetical protein